MKNIFLFKCFKQSCFYGTGIEIDVEEAQMRLERNVVKTCKWPEKLDPIIEEEEDDGSEVVMGEEVQNLEVFINHDETEEHLEEEEEDEEEEDVLTPCMRQKNSAVQICKVIMYWIAFIGGFGVSCIFGKGAMQIGRFLGLVNFVGALFYLVLLEQNLLNKNALEGADDVSEMQKGSKSGSQDNELAVERISIDSHSKTINRRRYACETEIKSANDESAITTLMENGNGEEMTERMSIDTYSKSVNEISETLTLGQRLAYELELQMSIDDFTKRNNGINNGGDLPKENSRSLHKRITENETKMKDNDLKTKPMNSNKIYGFSLFGKAWKRSRNYGSRCLKSARKKHLKLVLCL